MQINLPKKDDDGKFMISYSQISKWNEAKGFVTRKEGKEEYMMQYFFGEKFPDQYGFAQFGKDVEDYITLRQGAELFSEAERKTLELITPLGVFQKEFKLDFGDFYVLGYMDDTNKETDHVRDYKTASANSKKKYYEESYNQLDIYALAVEQETGKIPLLEVVCIERLGNGFRGGRSVMTVGETVWYIPRETNAERLDYLRNYIISTAEEISDYWTVFQKLNKM